ncbi:MAG: beta-hexosaminidase [Clostridiales bacterium]|nr:beta-hexosaminidase [Clostridiales bacterium]
MFYVRCPETDAAETVSKYHLGGYILFSRDFDGKTSDEVISDIASYQQEADIPLLIGVDEEGGTVVRVSSNPNLRSTPFLSPSDTYAEGGWDAIEEDAEEKADLLLSLGINVNMAPDCDITSDPDAFMYYRSFSSNVDNECKFVTTYVEITKSKQLGTVLKHFPGYGNNTDTHTGIAYDDRDYSEFEENDFKPFESGIAAGADCILAAHNIVTCMDSEYPASLSENVHNIIRDELNFDGVIMTDDLSMDAITDYTGEDSAAVFAAKCGNDVLCCTDVDVQYPAVLEAVQNGEISEEQVNQSVKRILIWKQNLGLI